MADLKRWSRNEISRIRSDMDRLFDDLCTDFDLPVMSCRIAGDLDLRQEDDLLVVRLELGTMNPEDVEVSVLEQRLIISAASTENSGGYNRSQTFRKELRLPCLIQTDQVVATFVDGVLEVRLPKCEQQHGQRIEISKK